MLYLNHSIQLETLAESFKEKFLSSEIWKNPFEAPLVIFSDSKVEKWFKLNVISKKDNPVLMNLKTQKLESFLFNTLADGINPSYKKDILYEKLSPQMLTSLILNKLNSRESDGNLYYKNLCTNNQALSFYIEGPDGSINQNNLYELANNICHIFNEYIYSRNDDFENGLHANWSKGKDFFDGKTIEEWQKKVYQDLLCDNVLTLKNEGLGYITKYVSLAQLVKINIESNGNKLKLNCSDKNVFLFGFNSMGQFYRSLLQELAKEVDLFVFLQANGIAVSEAKNPLLKSWNKTGSDNFFLWNKNANISISENKKIASDSLLHEIQNQIIEDRVDSAALEKYLQKNEPSFTVTGAPSTLKEVEALHSSICKILKNAKDKGENLSYSDFIVLAPDIQNYRVPVMQTFDQIEKASAKNYPYIPYVFSDYSGTQSAITEALAGLLSILKKGTLYRADLFSLLRNPVIKKARNFSEEEIYAWSNWVTNLNVFRNSKDSEDEWQILKSRLLISTLTEEVFENKNIQYKPYSDMESQNSESLFKFVDVLDKLEDFRTYFTLESKKSLSLEDINYLQEFLDYFFSLPDEKDDVLSGEKVVYSSIKSEIENHKLLLKADYDSLSSYAFFESLLENAGASKGNGSGLFAGGITFSNLTPNRSICAKYVYILGMDSKAFPGIDSELSLDLRISSEKKCGDESLSEKNKEAFLCQLMACGEELHLSFVNKDLKKDEDFFPASVIEDLFAFMHIDGEDFIKNISVDEVRNWSDLFTPGSFRNKTNFRDVTTSSEEDENPQKEDDKLSKNPGEQVQRVPLYLMKKFLENPFIFYAEQLFDSQEDVEGENESALYEPIQIDFLEGLNIKKNIIIEALKNQSMDIDKTIDEKLEELKLEHKLPKGIFGQYAKEELKQEISETVQNLKNFFDNNQIELDKIVFEATPNFRISANQNESNGWELTGNLCPYYFDEENKVLKVMDFVFAKKIKNSHKLKPYITGLEQIAEKENTAALSIEILLIHTNEVKVFPVNAVFEKGQARNILNGIYKKMYEKPFKKMILINLIDEDYNNFRDYLYAVENDSAWNSFPQKYLFNLYTDIGFKEKDFNKNEAGESNYQKDLDDWKNIMPGLF